MSWRRRWPWAEAIRVADELMRLLTHATERACIAGSLRRGKPTVGDIEIVYVPKYETRPDGLFDTKPVNLAEEAITLMLTEGILEKRLSVKGTFAWGAKNKLAVHRSGIPVDLFATTEDCWWNYLVCRTGPGESNIRICEAAIRRGWKWNPYGPGFSKATGEKHQVNSEREVFDFVGLPYKSPQERQ
jgi:DNA polymerase/3'-5' exonuclease PolX